MARILMLNDGKLRELQEISLKARKKIIEILGRAGSGHPGGSLSITDILVALYNGIMNIDPKDPRKNDRDRFVLSKGHGCPAMYVVLAMRGFFPMEDLDTLRRWGSHLQGHPDMKSTPGVDFSSGSLGQGLSGACGIALAGKIDRQSFYSYCVIGDGESQEGQVWEASMFAAHHNLDRLIVFLDHNKQQIEGKVEDIIRPISFEEKWKAFGWHVQTIDGHDHRQIFEAAEQAREVKGQPHMIVANTVKGKGVSFMEWNLKFHGTAPDKEETRKALEEITAKKQ